MKLSPLLLLLALPAVAQSQFSFTTNTDNTLTITGYTGSNGVVTLPDTIAGLPVKSIGSVAFYDYASLTSVTIPDSVTSVGFAAFDGCINLTDVTIGNSVTNIVSFPFHNCPSLTGIYFRGNAPTFRYGVLPPGNAVVYFLPGTTGWPTAFGFLPTALWLPQMQNSGATFSAQTNEFGFNINWASGQTVVVEACTDLAHSAWQPIQTNILTSDSVYFSDSQWTNYPGRFYRLRSL